MRSKSFAERIADVLIEDGLLLPNQLEEATAVQQKEGVSLQQVEAMVSGLLPRH